MTSGQKLVVISSTWGPDSLLATDPALPRRLTAELPADEFRVMLALHPNIRAHHSRWQVSQYLSGAERAGAHVPDDVDYWRAGVVAADLVVGDHGSVPFYSAALGNPLLLATAPVHTVDPGSPIARLLSTAPLLDRNSDLADQARQAIDDHQPERYAAIGALTTSAPDASAELLREAMYQTMRLPEPDHPADIAALPLPPTPLTGADAHVVHVEMDAKRSATITRFSAERLHTNTKVRRNTHLAVGVRAPQRRWLELADIIIGAAGEDTVTWICSTLARLPGCEIAAAPTGNGHWIVGNQDRQLQVNASDLPSRLFASLAYHLISRNKTIDDLMGKWTVKCAGNTYSVDVNAIAPHQ
ncbi:hypothetical protein ACQPW1_29810 [Nocardia sp. CA-128927]|uniref:hypothetical protein n=1 Tax=Nocardia sp. CA-128927 TaxID=3239975 RepID=UPI003D954532